MLVSICICISLAAADCASDEGDTPPQRISSMKKKPKKLPLDGELRDIFLSFASFGDHSSSGASAEMDGAKFAKFCRDTKV